MEQRMISASFVEEAIESLHRRGLPTERALAAYGVRVVAIAPGVFETPMMAAMPDEAREALGKGVPFPRRLGDPAEFAALARHIRENSMLNGEAIRIDGALRMPPR